MADKSIIQQIIEAITNLFKPKLSPEERRRQAELEYRMLARSFTKYDQELARVSEKFKRMAIECVEKGQKANALQAARYVRWLNRTRDKIICLSQRFEMMRIMGNVGDIMVQFMEKCSNIGLNLSEQIDVGKLANGEMNLRDGLTKIDFLADKIEQVFEDIMGHLDVMDDMDDGIIDDGIPGSPNPTVVNAPAGDIEVLNSILEEAGMDPIKSAAPAEKTAPAKPDEVSNTPVDDGQAAQVSELLKEFDKLNAK